MNAVRIILIVILTILILLFAYYNTEKVTLSFIHSQLTLPAFALVLLPFLLGVLITFLYYEIKLLRFHRYSRRITNGLRYKYLGFNHSAEKELKPLIKREEFLPIYLSVTDKKGVEKIDSESYSSGIFEASVAELIFKDEPEKAIDLLEKALGKNWNNLRAKRFLRNLYFIEGRYDKAINLSKEVINDLPKEEAEEEKKVLSSIAGWSRIEEDRFKISKLPLTVASALFTLERADESSRAKLFIEIIKNNLHNEVLAILTKGKKLEPEIVEITEKNSEHFKPLALALLYSELELEDKLFDLVNDLPNRIRSTILKKRGCVGGILEVVKPYICYKCGNEFYDYTPICYNCLSWNCIHIKGGRENGGGFGTSDNKV